MLSVRHGITDLGGREEVVKQNPTPFHNCVTQAWAVGEDFSSKSIKSKRLSFYT